MQRIMIAMLGIAVGIGAVGCGKENASDDNNKGNPLTSAKGPIGQGGDPAAMAARRMVQQQKAMNDLKGIGQLYNLYRIEAPVPTTDGFLKYVEQAKDLPAPLRDSVKEGSYVIAVPSGGAGVLAYEKEKDYQNTRVVVTTDGAVTKTMPEAEFQAAVKKGQ